MFYRGLSACTGDNQFAKAHRSSHRIGGHQWYNHYLIPCLLLAWAWLAKPKANVVIPKNQPLPNYLRKKTSKSAKHACHYATKKKRPVKITMYLGLEIIIKLRFTIIFDGCAILNVLNYLTKNFES